MIIILQRSVLEHQHAVVRGGLEDLRLQPFRDELQLAHDACHDQQGHDVDDDCVAQEVDQDRLEVEVNAVLHAVGREADHHWAQPEESQGHFVQTVPHARV